MTYTGKMVDGKAVITCGKCGAEHTVKMDRIGAVEEE